MYLAVSGTCYWCMEAVFSSLRGVSDVEQGFVKSKDGRYVEAAVFRIDESITRLEDIVSVHLATHSSTANHSARKKYPSAIYPMESNRLGQCDFAIGLAAKAYSEAVITQAKPFVAFYPNPNTQQHYFWRQPDKPFCQNTILPKLKALAVRFPTLIKPKAVQYLSASINAKQAKEKRREGAF
ncbi:peptide-methionine (S)-S-oxide reductase [Enterovibrio sp. 27052020O]|uniref:peptide-methionine (S)-S-oxide reductase n=1 Tax=Enterovibrio sp. 27052020O TaxID=3241166 RepID=UPI00388D4A3F